MAMASDLTSKAPKAAQKRVRVALLGAGIFMHNTYVPTLTAPEGVVSNLFDVRAVWSQTKASADRLADRLEEEGYVPTCGRYFGDVDALLDAEDLDAVIIALPPEPQLEIACKALARSVSVLQEKPIGVDPEAVAEAIATHARAPSGAVWAVGENYRFEPIFAAARGLMRESLGQVTHVDVHAAQRLHSGSPYFHTPWRRDAGAAGRPGGANSWRRGGFLFEGPVHLIAACRLLLGDSAAPGPGETSSTSPAAVTASATMQRRHAQVTDQPDTLIGWLRFEGEGDGEGEGKKEGEGWGKDGSATTRTANIYVTFSAASPYARWLVECERGRLQITRGPGLQYTLEVMTEASGAFERVDVFPYAGIERELVAFHGAVVRAGKEGEGEDGEGEEGKGEGGDGEGGEGEGAWGLSPAEAARDAACLWALFDAAEAGRNVQVSMP